MSRLTRDGTAEPVSRDQILRHARGQGNINFPCSADHEQDWQPYPVDPYSSAICDIHIYIQPGPVDETRPSNKFFPLLLHPLLFATIVLYVLTASPVTNVVDATRLGVWLRSGEGI